MSPTPEVVAARKLNNAKYALEDFDDAVNDLTKVGILFIVLALAMGLSMAFDANNFGHLFFSFAVGAALLVIPRLDFLPTGNLIGLTAGYFGVLAAEAVVFGLPDLLLPFLNAGEWRGFPVMANHMTPFIYWGLKLAGGVYILRLWAFRTKVLAQPEELLRKVAKDRVI